MDSSRMEVEDGEHIGDEYEFTEGVHGGEVESRNKNGLDMEVDHDAKQGQGSKEKSRDSGKHRSKDRKKERREEKEHGSRDRERSKNHDSTKNKDYNLDASDTKEKDRVMTRERRDDRDDREEYSKEKGRDKERNMEKVREKDYENAKYRDREHVRDKDREKELVRGKERGRERDKDRERDRDREKESERSRVRIRDHDKQSERDWKKDRGKEKELERDKDSDRDREGEKEWDRGKDKEREKEKGRDREKEKDKDRDKLETDKGKEKIREKDKDREKTKERENDKVDGRNRDRYEKEITKVKDRKRDEKLRTDSYEDQDMDKQETGRDTHGKFSAKDDKKKVEASNRSQSTLQLEERVLKMKEERLKKSEGASEVLAWVSKSRVLEEKRTAEKQKALQLSKVFEEQDNLDHGENEDEEAGATSQRGAKDLAGVKILHGLDKVAEGGAVVLTLKDQNILANGDINEEVDMLENVEIGEQKQRDEAYKAAKKKTGIYDDKFSDDPGSQRAFLPQYDDPVQDEGITLDESGRFTGEAEKKLEELRKRLQGASTSNRFEDLTSSGKMSSDFYTQEEMLQFKKPKKKKSLRKKNKLDLDALEAEAISAGLGAGDLGSRDEAKRRALKEERERSEAEIRSNAYQSAVAKAEEASKALRMEQTLTFQTEAENPVFGDDDEDLYKSLEKARKLALKKHGEAAIYGPQAVALLAVSNNQSGDKITTTLEEPEENKVVFTEMEEFVWGLQLDEETHKPEAEDVFMDEEVIPKSIEETKDEAGGWTEVKESGEDESPVKEQKEDIVADNTIHEPAVGKGLSGALQLLKERGTLKEDVDWGGRNMDKKKSKLVGINDNDGPKEMRIDRLDEFGRIMTPKEAFRMISHKFHGKGPGKTKQEKRMKQYHEELKLKQMKASDTPSQSMERMREAQARLQSPYLVLSGHVKPGQTSDPRSGFATVEKDHPGSLTPMLGDRKVEHFLGIKRKAEPSNMGPPKKPKI